MNRYIDADLLKSETVFRNRIWDKITDSKGRGLSEIIDSLPTADVQPVMRGEWIKDEIGAKYCSNCLNYPYDDDEYHIAYWSSKFCPHCGARMVSE